MARYDADGRVVGSAPRSVVYAEGLWHGATAVLVTSPDDARVYVHRRTDSKAFAPGHHDCFAGGVIAPGEDPATAAERELAEELGITGAPLEPLLHDTYVGDGLRYHLFAYRTRWNGRVRHQPSEVASGGWMPWPELLRRLDDPCWPFVPDGRQLLTELRARDLVTPARHR